MLRDCQWLQKTVQDFATPHFCIHIANLVREAYQRCYISRWGYYKLLQVIFPLSAMNWSLTKIFIAHILGYRVTYLLQHLLKPCSRE
jgi:hypothetical protein